MLQPTEWPAVLDIEDATWLNNAIQATAALTPTHVVIPGDPLWHQPPRADRARVQPHSTFRAHAHPVDELCLLMAGKTVMIIGDEPRLLTAPALVVLRSGVWHGEARYDDEPYDVFWIGLIGKKILYSGLSYYRQQSGWQGRSSLRLNTPQVESLNLKLGQGQSFRLSGWPVFQNELLATLVAIQSILPAVNASVAARNGNAAIVPDVLKYLSSHFAENITLDSVSHLFRLSPNYLNTIFRDQTGVPIHRWLITYRMEKAKILCKLTRQPIKSIAASVGFSDPLHFSRAFHKHFGCSPKSMRQGEVS